MTHYTKKEKRRIKEKYNVDIDEKMYCNTCNHLFYRWRYYRCPSCGVGH